MAVLATVARALVAAALLVHAIVAGPPIPARPDGFLRGPSDAQVQIEFFFDLMCPNCRDAWPAVRGMFEHFENATQHQLRAGRPGTDQAPTVSIRLHLFPLPYHHNAYLVAQGATALGAADEPQVWKWMEAVFAEQDQFGNPATDHMTAQEVREALVKLARRHSLDSNALAEGLHSAQADGNTRVSWKYACYRGVFGTPSFLINGVPAPEDAGGWDSASWIRHISELSGAPQTEIFSTSE